jgi:threonine/homoserine/homoserine lactone efflux protein
MPDWTSLASLVLTSLAVMGSPGPATVSVTAVGATFGVRRTLPYLVGLILGTSAVLAIVAAGLTAALLSLPFLAPALIGASLAYVLFLAYQIATAPPLSAIDPAVDAPGVPGGIILGVANPKAYFAIGAVFAANRLAVDPATEALMKTAVLFAMIIVIHLAWLLAGAAIAGTLRDPARARVVNIGLAIALVVFSAVALIPRGG